MGHAHYYSAAVAAGIVKLLAKQGIYVIYVIQTNASLPKGGVVDIVDVVARCVHVVHTTARDIAQRAVLIAGNGVTDVKAILIAEVGMQNVSQVLPQVEWPQWPQPNSGHQWPLEWPQWPSF